MSLSDIQILYTKIENLRCSDGFIVPGDLVTFQYCTNNRELPQTRRSPGHWHFCFRKIESAIGVITDIHRKGFVHDVFVDDMAMFVCYGLSGVSAPYSRKKLAYVFHLFKTGDIIFNFGKDDDMAFEVLK